MHRTYRQLVLGGTFDHFHVGHESLLAEAFSLADHIVIGLTHQDMSRKKAYAHTIQSYDERFTQLLAFATSLGRERDIEIREIHDVYGGADRDTKHEAILVTPQTHEGALLINTERLKHALSKLPIHVCDLLVDDQGEPISSTRIRAGEIDRKGFRYISLLQSPIVLAEQQRVFFSKPLGEVFPDERALRGSPSPLILVGDVLTDRSMRSGLFFSAAYIDGQSARQPYPLDIPRSYTKVETAIHNPAGTIDPSAADIQTQISDHECMVYVVSGEEDMITAVAILLAPLESTVAYGNRYGDPGIVVVSVTEEKKAQVRQILAS